MLIGFYKDSRKTFQIMMAFNLTKKERILIHSFFIENQSARRNRHYPAIQRKKTNKVAAKRIETGKVNTQAMAMFLIVPD